MSKILSYTWLAFFSFVVLCSYVSADVVFVPTDFPTIQSAINAVSDGDYVILEDGTFTGTGNRDIRFQGKAITVRSLSGSQHCVIDCEGTPEDPFRGFIFDSGETTDSVLEGISIRGGATLPGAVLDQFNGGGLFFFDSSATVRDCNISGNDCGCWGAGIYATDFASPVFVSCEVSSNSAGDDGGALFTWNGANVTMINCKLNNNFSAVTGGAIANFGGADTQTHLINCCIAFNEAPFGSAILGSHVALTNTIVWGNFGSERAIWSTITVNNSIVQGGHEGFGNMDVDPQFVDAANLDFRIMATSPAVDNADEQAIPDWVVTDFNGHPRHRGNTDIGPYELQKLKLNNYSIK